MSSSHQQRSYHTSPVPGSVLVRNTAGSVLFRNIFVLALICYIACVWRRRDTLQNGKKVLVGPDKMIIIHAQRWSGMSCRHITDSVPLGLHFNELKQKIHISQPKL